MGTKISVNYDVIADLGRGWFEVDRQPRSGIAIIDLADTQVRVINDGRGRTMILTGLDLRVLEEIMAPDQTCEIPSAWIGDSRRNRVMIVFDGTKATSPQYNKIVFHPYMTNEDGKWSRGWKDMSTIPVAVPV